MKCARCDGLIQLRNLRPAVNGRYYHAKCEPKPRPGPTETKPTGPTETKGT